MQPSFRQTGIISRLLPIRCREKTAVNTRILEIAQLLNELSDRVQERPDNVFEKQLAHGLLLIDDQVRGLAQGTLAGCFPEKSTAAANINDAGANSNACSLPATENGRTPQSC